MAQYKKVTVEGKVKYIKPSKKKESENYNPNGYKPLKQNRNMWYFHNTTDLSKQIWELGQGYYKRMINPESKPKHPIKNPASLVKLLYFLFLTGARQQEPFLEPFPIVEIVQKPEWTYVVITHVNEKHPGQKVNTVIETIPIFDEYEKKMWEWITDYGSAKDGESIFRYKAWKSTRKNNITALFNKNFTTTLEDPNHKVHKNEGISPHILRHLRAYHVLIRHNVPREMAQIWFGWDNQNMIDYYSDIRNVMKVSDQEKMLERSGLLHDKEGKPKFNYKIEVPNIFTAP